MRKINYDPFKMELHKYEKKFLSTDTSLEIPKVGLVEFDKELVKVYSSLRNDNSNDLYDYKFMYGSLVNVCHLMGDKRSEMLCRICMNMGGYWGCYYRAALFNTFREKDTKRALLPFLKYGTKESIEECIAHHFLGSHMPYTLDRVVKKKFDCSVKKMINEAVNSEKITQDDLKHLRTQNKILEKIVKIDENKMNVC